MNDVDIAAALVATGELLWHASLRSGARNLFEWMHEPRLGDFVMVTMCSPKITPLMRVGHLAGAWTLIFPPDDAQDEDTPYHERAREEVYEIAGIDGESTTWTNASYLRIPSTQDELVEARR